MSSTELCVNNNRDEIKYLMSSIVQSIVLIWKTLVYFFIEGNKTRFSAVDLDSDFLIRRFI